MLRFDPEQTLRADDWRRDPAAWPFRYPLWPRFGDVDPLQHLNNVALIGYHQEACQRLLLGVLGDGAWRSRRPLVAMACNTTEYLAEAHYPDLVEAGAGFVEVDADGFVIASALFQRGQCVGVHLARYGGWEAGLAAPLATDVGAAIAAAIAVGGETAPVPASATPALVSGPAPALGDFPWRGRMRSRFADRDARDILGDTALARYAEHIRSEMVHAILADVPEAERLRAVVARVDLAVARRRRPPLNWDVGGGIIRIGNRSATVRCGLYDGADCHAVCDAVIVLSDADPAAPAGAAIAPVGTAAPTAAVPTAAAPAASTPGGAAAPSAAAAAAAAAAPTAAAPANPAGAISPVGISAPLRKALERFRFDERA